MRYFVINKTKRDLHVRIEAMTTIYIVEAENQKEFRAVASIKLLEVNNNDVIVKATANGTTVTVQE